MSASPPPSNSAQDSKSKRYDRQIRIWGAEGQQRLESSRIALLNCSPTGSETLKNLVLGGIASFTIVDGQKVEARDLGNNFLIDAGRLGQSRAQVVTDLLKEMNDSVSGSYVEDTPEELLDNHPQFIDNFDLVIATQVNPWFVILCVQQTTLDTSKWHMNCLVIRILHVQMREQQLLKLDELCQSKGVKLLAVRSYGLMGYMRVRTLQQTSCRAHADSSNPAERMRTSAALHASTQTHTRPPL